MGLPDSTKCVPAWPADHAYSYGDEAAHGSTDGPPSARSFDVEAFLDSAADLAAALVPGCAGVVVAVRDPRRGTICRSVSVGDVRSGSLVRKLSLSGRRSGELELFPVAGQSFGEPVGTIATALSAWISQSLDAHWQVTELLEALESHDAIGQAIGMLMERFDLSAPRAFALLLAQSNVTRRRTRDVAAEVVAAGTRSHRQLPGQTTGPRRRHPRSSSLRNAS